MPDQQQYRTSSPSGRSTAAGYLALVLAFVVCPCHLPLLLIGLGAVLGGTTATAAITASAGVLVASAVVFVLSLGAGAYLLWGRTAGGHQSVAGR